MTTFPTMLDLRDICYHPSTSTYSILKEVCFSADYGEITIISGKSGSGKTTLLEITSGLSNPTKGHVYFDKKKLNKKSLRNLVGFVFQFPERYFLGLTANQELNIGQKRISKDKITSTLEKVSLQNLNLKQSPEKMSGGMQRRLAIAVQLLKDPEIMIFDEPTAGLDWSSRSDIVNLIKRISRKKIVIVSSHEQNLFKDKDTVEYKLEKGYLNKR